MKYLGKQSVFDDLMIGGVLLTPPDPATYSYELTLPNDDGTAGQVLTTDGNGVLTWVTNSAGGTGVSMTNGVDNRVMTATAAQAITGEANLTFDGDVLTHTPAAWSSTKQFNILDLNDSAASSTRTTTGILLDYDKTVANSNTMKVYGIDMNLTDSGDNTGGVSTIYGQRTTLNFAVPGSPGTTTAVGLSHVIGGADSQWGFRNVVTGSTDSIGIYSQVQNGGIDFKSVSHANLADYFTIATGEDGETTFTTVEDGVGSTAHINFIIDGKITMTPADITGDVFHLDANADADNIVNIDAGILDIDVTGATTITGGGLLKIDAAGVEIENTSATGAPALLIDNNDVDQNALLIEAANTTGHILDIEAGALTTADAIHIKADALSTGSGLHLDINDTLTTNNTKSLIKLDYDRTGVAATGQFMFPTGLEISMTDSATNIGFVNMKGIDINMDHSSTGGSISSIGIDIDMNGGDVTTGMTINAASTGILQTISNSTGKELDFRSSVNLLDSFTLTTGTNAETTLTTVDWDAALAHFNVVADGNITLDAVGDIEINADSGNINFKDDSASLAKISTAGLSFENNTGAGIIFDGATDNAHMTTLSVIDPTGTRAVNLPNASGTVALTTDIPDEVVSTGLHIHKQTKVTLDAAACTALNSAPQTLVAAQGANTIIVPVSVTVLADRNSADSSGADLIVGYNNTTNYQLALRYMRRFMLGITTDMQFNMAPFFAGHGATSLTGGTDVPLTISTSAAITGGSMTSMVIYTSYYVIDNS